jgi:hypothetical protein
MCDAPHRRDNALCLSSTRRDNALCLSSTPMPILHAQGQRLMPILHTYAYPPRVGTAPYAYPPRAGTTPCAYPPRVGTTPYAYPPHLCLSSTRRDSALCLSATKQTHRLHINAGNLSLIYSQLHAITGIPVCAHHTNVTSHTQLTGEFSLNLQPRTIRLLSACRATYYSCSSLNFSLIFTIPYLFAICKASQPNGLLCVRWR